jgi:hypothetical protein
MSYVFLGLQWDEEATPCVAKFVSQHATVRRVMATQSRWGRWFAP